MISLILFVLSLSPENKSYKKKLNRMILTCCNTNKSHCNISKYQSYTKFCSIDKKIIIKSTKARKSSKIKLSLSHSHIVTSIIGTLLRSSTISAHVHNVFSKLGQNDIKIFYSKCVFGVLYCIILYCIILIHNYLLYCITLELYYNNIVQRLILHCTY